MKSYIKSLSLILIIAFSSCEDEFLDRKPLSEVSPQTYFQTEDELQAYINGLYKFLPGSSIFQGDGQSDNMAPKSFNEVVAGNHQVPTDASEAGWTWDYLRDVNFFLENYQKADLDEDVKNHYGGIAKFFRAWFYFEKVKRFGDVPWYGTVIQNSEVDLLYKARDSREMIMDSIMSDLDFASKYVFESTPGNTVNRWVALALKSRVALYEGTYRKYHNLQNAGIMLENAVEASQLITEGATFSLYSTGQPQQDYLNLFVSDEANADEFLLSRAYDNSLNEFHIANSTFLTGTLLSPGMTKSFVNSYLMADGSRFTDQNGYEDMTFVEETQNRDPRLSQTIRTPGYSRIGNTVALAPDFDNARTGYQIIKFVMSKAYDNYNTNVNDLPIFRYAEVLLNFAEAKAELNTLSQADLDASINLIRTRAGMPAMVLGNLTIDPILASRYPNVNGASQAAVLEIRRERRIELAVEDFRYDDLMRWDAGELLAEPFRGMVLPNSGKVDVDGDGLPDIQLVEVVPAEQEDIQYLIIGKDFTLDNGQIVMYPGLSKEFIDPKHYLFPLPRTELLLNENLEQNPGWF